MIHRPSLTMALFTCAVLLSPTLTLAEEKNLVSEHERGIAQKLGAAGPTETKGIESAIVKGTIPLVHDFPALEGRMLRAREITILPGGVVAVHQHESRPGVAYVLEGELIEHRSDEAAPLVRRPGDVSLEKAGVIHWWENVSTGKARVLVVDIVPE